MNDLNNYESKAVAVGTTPESLLPTNKNRTFLVLFNQGDETVRVYFDVSAAYLEIKKGQGIHFAKAPINEVTAQTTTGTTTLTVWEA